MENERIGQMLVAEGVVSRARVNEVFQRQKHSSQPFTDLIADVAGLSENELWNACARQLLPECPYVNLVRERLDPSCLSMVSPRDAWERLVLPLRMEDGQLVVATTEQTLGSAIGLLQQRVVVPFRFVLAQLRLIEQFIAELYAYEGVEIHEHEQEQ